jgi:PAS domain S-box-containing protein
MTVAAQHRILVVEDEPAIAVIEKRVLEKEGYLVEVAEDGRSALNSLNQGHYDLVLLDHRLPDTLGSDVIKELGERISSLPVIVITGFGDEKLAVDLLKAGVADYVVKDAKLEFLRIMPRAVRAAIEQFSLAAENQQLHDDLYQINCELEKRVEQRTRELAATNRELEQEIADRRMAELAARESELRYRTLMENIPGLVYRCEVKPPWRVTHMSEGALPLTGHPASEFLNGTLSFGSLIVTEEYDMVVAAVADGVTGHHPYEIEYRINHADGDTRWLYEKGQAIYDENGQPQWLDGVVLDISERKHAQESFTVSVREKEVLRREIHHRVRNNLQVVTSMLRLQLRRADEPEIRAALTESENRVKAMALIHDTLHGSDNLAAISCQDYIGRLLRSLSRMHASCSAQIKTQISDIDLHVDQAVPVGLIINELVTNAFHHAFPDQQPGQIMVLIEPSGKKHLEVSISDNGIGLPSEVDPRTTDTMGLRMVTGLAENQLGGSLDVSVETGTCITIKFKRVESRESRAESLRLGRDSSPL